MAVSQFSSMAESTGQLLERVMEHPLSPRIATIAALVLLVYGGARLTWRVLQPPAPPPVAVLSPIDVQPALNLQPLLIAGIFGQPPTNAGSLNPNELPQTSLNLVLTGVMVLGPLSQALASVDGQEQNAYGIGQDLAPGAKLEAVYADRIVLRRGALLEMAPLKEDSTLPPGAVAAGPVDPPPGSIPVISPIQRLGSGAYNINRQALTAQVTPEVLQQASVAAGPNGLVMRDVQAGSMFEQVGLKPGDVLKRINGRDVKSLDDLFKVYAQVSASPDARRIQVELLRGGKSQVIEYNLQ